MIIVTSRAIIQIRMEGGKRGEAMIMQTNPVCVRVCRGGKEINHTIMITSIERVTNNKSKRRD